MIEHITFISYFYFFLFSLIGYGFLFSKIIYKDLIKLDLGYQGIIGFFALYIISISSSFFISHNYVFNSILHIIGIAYFINLILKDKKNYINELKKILILSIILLIGIYVFKNHDDFPYYHLTYALNLSENPLIIGTGVFSHGFKTSSSLFYFHSILFMPGIKYFMFHSGPFFILIFFNFIVINKIILKFKNKEIDFVYYFSLINLIFVDVVFYRIGEHGTDRSGQILLFLIFISFFELILQKNKKKEILLVNFLLIGIFLASSMKALFYIYLILVPIVIFKNKLYSSFLKIKNFKLILILSFTFFITLFSNFLSTGCFLYPAEKTCIGKFDWSVSKPVVKQMKIHYEWWAKAGGGPGFKVDMDKEEYVKDFNWVGGWIERHFFNKVSDTLLGIIFISILVFMVFKNKSKKKINFKDFLIVYLILFIFLIEWFLSHPSMRYGGFVLISMPFFIFTCQLIETFKVDLKRVFKMTTLLIIVTLLTYNLRNVNRLNKEINFYKYDIINSPYFHVDDVKSNVVYEDHSFKIYTPIKNMCWASKTPCSYAPNLEVRNIFHMKVVYLPKK